MVKIIRFEAQIAPNSLLLQRKTKRFDVYTSLLKPALANQRQAEPGKEVLHTRINEHVEASLNAMSHLPPD